MAIFMFKHETKLAAAEFVYCRRCRAIAKMSDSKRKCIDDFSYPTEQINPIESICRRNIICAGKFLSNLRHMLERGHEENESAPLSIMIDSAEYSRESLRYLFVAHVTVYECSR